MERKQCHLTHDGVAEAQRVAGIGSFYVDENMDLPHLLEQSLRAHAVYELDRDYVVMPAQDPQTGDGAVVVIVDVEHGPPDDRAPVVDGLHQAVECKEGVPIKQETQTVATITIQNFFKMYKRLAGMTGTADTEAQEFHDIYKLDVVAIPTNKPVIRRDYDDLVFLRPRTSGTPSSTRSRPSTTCRAPHPGGHHERREERDALQDAHEQARRQARGAQRQAARARGPHRRERRPARAVMIATNMAGRGTDIKLGASSRASSSWSTGSAGASRRAPDGRLHRRAAPRAVFRKIAPQELGIRSGCRGHALRGARARAPAPLGLNHTWLSPKQIDRMSAESCAELDSTGGSCSTASAGSRPSRTWAACTSSAPSATRPAHRQPAPRPVRPPGRQGLVRFFVSSKTTS
jgi:hypothetical protein